MCLSARLAKYIKNTLATVLEKGLKNFYSFKNSNYNYIFTAYFRK